MSRTHRKHLPLAELKVMGPTGRAKRRAEGAIAKPVKQRRVNERAKLRGEYL